MPEHSESPRAAAKGPHQNRPTGEAKATSASDATTDSYSAGQLEALEHARHLAEHGVPLFLAQPAKAAGKWDPQGGHNGSGYWFPDNWQAAKADPSVVDRWRPGLALCAVMGHAVDAVDVDAQHDGDVSAQRLIDAGQWPRTYGRQRTASGGWHDLVAPLGVGSCADALPGVDLRAGTPDGTGRGFIFLAPTRKLSKLTGRVGTYRWTAAPDLSQVVPDATGHALVARVAKARQRDTNPADRRVGPAGVDAALARECTHVAWAEEGTRNHALNTAAFNLGQLVGEYLSTDEVQAALTEAALEAGLEPEEVEGTIASGLEAGMAAPRTTTPDDTPADKRFEAKVQQRVENLLVDTEARQRVQLLHRPEMPEWDAGTLAQQLAKPAPPKDRVEGLIPWEASTEAVAMRKTGKTTFGINLGHSLITGEPFLGRFPVVPVQGRVGFLNYEVSGFQLAKWAELRGIPQDRFFQVNLRGTPNPFRDPHWLEDLGKRLSNQDVETLIVDPFGRAFTGDNQNDAGQVQAWLVQLDEFARGTVGAKDVVLTVHAGWEGKHARGSSALEDWPDALVYLTRDKADRRWIEADGRDVELEAHRLLFDEGSVTQTIGHAKGAKAEDAAEPDARPELMQAMSEALAKLPPDHKGLSGGRLDAEVHGKTDDKRAARHALEELGYIAVERTSTSFLHRLVKPYVVGQEAARADFEEDELL